RCPHHVENARREAEQQKYDQPPQRDPKPSIEHPADGCPEQHPRDELGREPKATCHRRRIGGRTLTRTLVGRTVGMNMAEPFAETLKPRGKRSLIGCWLL